MSEMRQRKPEESKKEEKGREKEIRATAAEVAEKVQQNEGKALKKRKKGAIRRSLFGPAIVVLSIVLAYVGLFQWERVEELVQSFQNSGESESISSINTSKSSNQTSYNKGAKKGVPCPLGFGDPEDMSTGLPGQSCEDMYSNAQFEAAMKCYQETLERLVETVGNQTAHPDVAHIIEQQGLCLSAMSNVRCCVNICYIVEDTHLCVPFRFCPGR